MGAKARRKWEARFGPEWRLRRGALRAAEGFDKETVKLEQNLEARSRRKLAMDAALRDAAEVTVGMFKRRAE